MRVTRIDYAGPTRGVRQTPQGGLCVEAAVSRTGVLEYSDGERTWREYRPPEEVFAEDSLATLRAAPVTDLHPPKLVTPETFASVTRGTARDNVRRDGIYVVTDLAVQDAGLCRLVQTGERREVSLGYTCEVDKTPGVTPEGERYDAVQRKIRVNHVALLPPGEGRSGPEVSLRMDGAAVEVRRDAAKGNGMKRKIKIRGKVYRIDGDTPEEGEKLVADAEAAVEAVSSDFGAQIAELQTKLTEALTLGATLGAQMQAQAATAPPPPAATEEPSEEVLDAALAVRETLREDAAAILGKDYDTKGKKPAEIKAAVLAKVLPTVKLDGLSAAAIDGMFRGAVAGATTLARNDALGAANAAANARADADDDPGARMRQRTRERSTAPLTGKAS